MKSLLIPIVQKLKRGYTLVINSLPLLREKGPFFVAKKAFKVLRRLRVEKNILQEQYNVPAIQEEQVSQLDVKISIVIPMKNAGMELQDVLEKLRNQKGIREVEVIVVDSGSQDDTLQIAKTFTSHVYSIDPADFNHGITRNFGAEKATGDFLVFMSQDAMPIGDFCIFDVVSKMLKDGGIAAATVKQVPRSDADMFASWQLWVYNERLLRHERDRMVSLTEEQTEGLGPSERRRCAQIDNVFSCVRKDVFEKFKFKPLSYAEDLDLGIRLLTAGYKILFLTSVGVIHSHMREPMYYLKRAYVDIKTLSELLKFDLIKWEELGISSIGDLLTYVCAFYKEIDHLIGDLSAVPAHDFAFDDLVAKVKRGIPERYAGESSLGKDGLNSLFEHIFRERYAEEINKRIKHDVIRMDYCSAIESLAEYLKTSDRTISAYNYEEVVAALRKLLSWTCGSHIGNYSAYSLRHLKTAVPQDVGGILALDS
jgi:glycosyltransferase involved in cell wall biosynthesis